MFVEIGWRFQALEVTAVFDPFEPDSAGSAISSMEPVYSRTDGRHAATEIAHHLEGEGFGLPPPEQEEHSAEILREAGCDEAAMATWIRR